MRRCGALFLTRLAEASGIATPTRAELARFDRSRTKKTSNAEWTHPHDPDARVTKMKAGRTHLAHTMPSIRRTWRHGAVAGVTVQGAKTTGDTASMVETLIAAAEQVEAVLPDGPGIEEVVGDKGYHSNETMADVKALGLRSYISEPDRGRWCWKQRQVARDTVYANRRRSRGERGHAAPAVSRGVDWSGRSRSSVARLERDATGPSSRASEHVSKTAARARLPAATSGCGGGTLIGVGTPRSLQGRAAALLRALFRQFRDYWGLPGRAPLPFFMPHSSRTPSSAARPERPLHFVSVTGLTPQADRGVNALAESVIGLFKTEVIQRKGRGVRSRPSSSPGSCGATGSTIGDCSKADRGHPNRRVRSAVLCPDQGGLDSTNSVSDVPGTLQVSQLAR